jgi:hypothetical protein
MKNVQVYVLHAELENSRLAARARQEKTPDLEKKAVVEGGSVGPGTHPLLEDFKLIHRALDVKKVQAEVRRAELENIRLAARALEGEREDPDVEKKIVIETDSRDIILQPDND